MSAIGRSQRAFQRGQLFHAELAARELGRRTLADALDLLVLIAKDDHGGTGAPRRVGMAASRSRRRLDLAESQLALAALGSLPVDVDGASAMLERIAERHDVQLGSARRRPG